MDSWNYPPLAGVLLQQEPTAFYWWGYGSPKPLEIEPEKLARLDTFDATQMTSKPSI